MRLLVFSLLNVLVLDISIFCVSAKAPTTPKILFTSTRDDKYAVYIMNPDGTEQTSLTQLQPSSLHAVWSPTGEEILFVSDRDGKRDLYLMDSDGSNVQRLFKRELKGRTYRDYPTWSPDGKQFAYMHINWDKDVYTIHIGNLGEQEEDFLAHGWHPAWSPDGSEIAYSPEDFRVTLINVHTGTRKRILPKKVFGGQMRPSWSAMADRLAFSWNKHPLPPDFKPGDKPPEGWADKRTIYIINRDGTSLQQLLEEAGPYAQHPVLSPNGEEVLYTQKINGKSQIFKLDINSRIRTQLTHIGKNFCEDWFDPAYALSVLPQPQLLTTTWAKMKRGEDP